jgi:transposase
MRKSTERSRTRGRGVGTASPHVEGAQRPDQSGPDESGTDPLAEARRAEHPSERAPHGGPKIAPPFPLPHTKECPPPEVSERPTRRLYTAGYKLRILQEADACKDTGGIGKLLRREGLYSSNLGKWRQELAQRTLTALEPRKRGRRAEPKNPLASKVAELERVVKRQGAQLKHQQLLLEIQKKMAELLGASAMPSDNEEERS